MGKEQDLLEAARNGNVVTIEKLIGNKGKKGGGISALTLSSLRRSVNINFADGNGDTALHLAALAGHKESVQLLLQHEASVSNCDDKGCSPLHMAAWTGSAEVCQMILSHGSPLTVVNLQNCDGDTALHCASQYGHTNAVTALMEAEADPMIRNLKEESPLDLAAQYGREDVVRLLMTRHPSLAFHVHQKHSPLHLASRYGHPAVVTLLLANGFEVGLKTSHGTALHEASCYCKEDVIRTLLEHGINGNETDSEGRTATDILAALNTQKALNMIKYIKEYSTESGSQSSQSKNTQPIPNSQTQPHSSMPPPHSQNSQKHSHSLPEHSLQQPHSSVLKDPQSSEPQSSHPLPHTTPLTIQVDGVKGEPEYVSPEGHTADDPTFPIYAKPNKLKSKATSGGLDAPPLPPRNSAWNPAPGSPRSRGTELTVDRGTREASPSYMEMGQSAHPKISPGKPPRRRNPKSESSTDPPDQTNEPKSVSAVIEKSAEEVSGNSLTESVYEQMSRANDPQGIKAGDKGFLYGNLLEAAEATLSSIRTSLAGKQETTGSKPSNTTISDSEVELSKNVPQTKEAESKGDKSEEVQLRQSSTLEATDSRDSVGSGKGSRPPSLEFDNVRSRLLSQEMPLTPTGYSQPPTPDHPPPSPHTAVIGIHERINPMDKRKSRDIETLTEPSLLGGIPERDPEMEECELESEPQGGDSYEDTGQSGCEGSGAADPGGGPVVASVTSDSASQTVTSITTTTTPEVSSTTTCITTVNQSHPVISVNSEITSDCDSIKGDSHNANNSSLTSMQKVPCEPQLPENTSKKTETDIGKSPLDTGPSGNSPAVGDSPGNDVNGVRKEPVVNGVVLRRKSGTLTSSIDSVERRTSEGSQDSINTEDGEPFSAGLVQHVFERLLKGSQPGGSRNVVSQIYQNVLIRRPKSRHKRLSAPSAIVTFDPLMEREDEINAEKFMEAIDQAIAEGAATGETIPPVEEANFDDSEEWAKIAAIMASFGAGIARESVFIRDYEDDFATLLGGIQSRHSAILDETGKIVSVGDWLEGLGLAQYENTLIAHGFDDLDFLGGDILVEDDLKQIGVENEDHRRRILEASKLLPPVIPIGPHHLPSSVEDWLSRLRLSEYWHTFNSHGYTSMDRVRKLWELELATVLDITNIGHRKRLLASLGERQIDKSEKLHVDITDWNINDAHEDNKPEPSPIEGLDFYKDYTKVKHKPVDRRSDGGTTTRNSRLQFDSSEDEDSLKRTGRSLRDSTIHIRPPHMAHTTSPATQWRHRPEKLIKGCCNYVAQYLGSTLVKELNGIDSTREGMTKMKSSAEGLAKIPVIMLSISYKGVKFIDAKTKRTVCEHEIGNIFCACQDPENLNFFAYITKDKETNKHYCHVFSVTRTDLAREIILTLGEAFEIAYQVALKDKAEEEAVEFERKLGQGSDAEDSHSSKTSLNTI